MENNKYKRIKDHYFAAWLIVKHDKDYIINNNIIKINCSNSEYKKLLREYEDIKPVFTKIKYLVKEFSTLANTSTHS